MHGSSGTSGKPTLYAFSRSDWDYIADVMAQGLYTCGVRPGDVVQLATVFSLFMGGWGALLGVERLGRDRLSARRRRDGAPTRLDASHRLDGADHDADLCAAHAGDRALARLRHRRIRRCGSAFSSANPARRFPAPGMRWRQGWGIKVRDMATTSEMTPWATNAECEDGRGAARDAGRGLDRDRRQGRFAPASCRTARAARSSTRI